MRWLLPLCFALPSAATAAPLDRVGHIIVIYMENRSFDALFGTFPGANGVGGLTPAQYRQLDRDGATVLPKLPPIWGGFAPKGYATGPASGYDQARVTEAQTADLPNAPFVINAPPAEGGLGQAENLTSRDMWHRFYENQMQIHGGRNDMFAAWADGGGLVMGRYQEPAEAQAQRPFWRLAREYVLFDNFYQGAFGGSYLNHQFLICACTPVLTPAQQRRAGADGKTVEVPVSAVHENPDGSGPALDPTPKGYGSALTTPPKFAASTNLAPVTPIADPADPVYAADPATHRVYYTINTMQPPFAPSLAAGKPDSPVFTPPQTQPTIGDQLDAAGIDWRWYAGAMGEALRVGPYAGNGRTDGAQNPAPNFQAHHNPFNYYEKLDPVAHAEYRARHLKDGGLDGAAFVADIDRGDLPPVTFYKPQGNLNSHPGYAAVRQGEEHVAGIIRDHIMRQPKIWNDAVIVITYDEFGGQWDHAAPPRGDMFGPGTRIPALIVSPFARRGTVDHSINDTTSILRLIEHRFGLPALYGVARRTVAIEAHTGTPPGDMSSALH